MGWRVRNTIRIDKNYRVNLSKSEISTSTKFGPVTINSKRGTTIRVALGISFHVDQAAKRIPNRLRTPQQVQNNVWSSCLLETVMWILIVSTVVTVGGIVFAVLKAY